jgi:arylsulfate sulfotransferase
MASKYVLLASRLGRSCAVGVLSVIAMALAGCGGSSNTSSAVAAPPGNAAPPTSTPPPTQAEQSGIEFVSSQAGSSPFINLVLLTGAGISELAGVEFSIAPKPGSVSAPVDVWYSIGALTSRGYIASDGMSVTVPVFGLYANYANQVLIQLQFLDGSTRSISTPISTAAYTDPTNIYANPTILTARAPASTLGFDFFMIKSVLGSPVIIDTDGEIRWVVPGFSNATSSAFQDYEFVIGDAAQPTVHRLQLDGTLAQSPLQSPNYTEFHHNIDPGKLGLLAEVNQTINGVESIQATIVEINDQGSVLYQWDLAAIISAYMTSEGDNASAFVRPGVDWFHSNATTYDPSDDSVIVSSRENFVIKIDYRSGNIRWILGDPTKYWYTFPSLRAKALTLAAGGLYPVGQHGISITSNGLLMLFNDGLGSVNQPAGQPAGITRTYSAVSAYSIDTASMTATEVWRFDHDKTIFSEICSSAYESPGQSILVDYAVADNVTHARLIGLGPTHNVVFDFQYPTASCDTSWNAIPIGLGNLTIY